MAHEYPAIDLNAGDVPDIAELAEEVHRTNQPRVIRRADEELAVVMPAVRRTRRTRKGKPVTEDDPLFRAIGIGHSGRGDISANKHAYLAEAYAAKKS
jgi:hypothetical protein